VRTVWEACKPRKEVVSGRIRGDIFAAKLGDVVAGKAPDVYQKPAPFFENTFPTGGLKALLDAVFTRLTKAGGGDPCIRLETSFGGGKTHNLIALYHIARSPDKVGDLSAFMPKKLIPKKPFNAAGVVGTEVELTGQKHDDITAYTLWGEMAYQLGRKRGYGVVAEADKERTPPGAQLLQELVGDEPTILMIDEIAHYLRVASKKGDLADLTVAFLHRLIEFTTGRDNVVLVLTLAESKDAYTKETEDVLSALKEAYRVSARQEIVLTPTEETEIASVVAQRLFEDISPATAKAVARAYLDHYRKAAKQGVPIPATASQAAYGEEIERSYPFHPELLDVLNRKVSTIPNFQKTRGVLRLLGHTVRQVWRAKPPDAYLIHPYHVDLAVEGIRNELTGRLDKGELAPVIQADIYSGKKANPSHAQRIDKDWLDKGQPPLAQRLGQTIFLHSLCAGTAAGAEPAELNLAVGEPGLDYDFIDKTLGQMTDTFWHLAPDTTRYRLQVEANIVKVIDSEMDNIGTAEAKNELDLRIRAAYETEHFEAAFFPEDPSGVDDDAGLPKLVIPHYDSVKIKAADSPPPTLIRNIYERAGTQGRYRNFQNNVVFLAAGAAEIGPMIKVCRRYKALRRITDSPERMSDFSKQQQKKLKGELADAELGVRVAITKAYRHLFYPDPTAPAERHGLAHYVMPVQEAAEAKKHQQDAVLRILRNLKKVMVADDEPDAPDYIKEKLWPSGTDQMTTEDFRKAFCKKRSLPIVLAADLIKRTVRDGVVQGTWVYFDGERAFHAKTALPSVQLTDDQTLYTPEKAEELGLLVEVCPKCGKYPCVCEEKVCPKCGQRPCVCKELCPLCGKPPAECICGAPKIPLEGEGSPSKAFSMLHDACTDGKVETLSAVAIESDVVEDVRRLSLAISQLPGTLPHVTQSFSSTQESDRLDLTFEGAWKTFGTVRKFVEDISKQLTDKHVDTRLRVEFDPPVKSTGEEIAKLRKAIEDMQVGTIKLTGRSGDKA